ncbi:unnamed protein product [Schistosoma turkestanicum]|nr:unnamed protein product [Schistosoma turkestanicum]
MQFAEALLSSDDANFERLLYDEVRTQALEVCTPQVFKPADNMSTETFGDSDFESSKSEYAALERTLFRSFELFIAGKEFFKYSDSSECAKRLEAYLQSLAPSEQGICGRIFQANEPTYCCSDCAIDPTCVLCRECFVNSVHIKHNYKISTSAGVGYCDCGDHEAWRSDAWCKSHKIKSKIKETEANNLSKLANTDNIDVKLKSELENLRRRIHNLPRDIVLRTGKLLKPLINSSILCLTDLIQGTSRLSTEPLSNRLHLETSSTDCPMDGNDTEQQIVVDLWSTDDGLVDYKMDNENTWDDWPPPLSHIPLVSPSEDASVLRQDAWPRTAPKRRSAVDVEARCLAQLERARTYHPRLFPPRPMRTASERTAASRAFLVLLYNNEYHNYEQVIKTLRRVLDCTTQQGTHYAVLVNCDGRAVLQTNLTASQASNLASIIMRTSTSLSTRPIYCIAQHADIYSMEVFFTLFIRWLRRFCDQVPSLRPIICHAILGHLPSSVRHQRNTTTTSSSSSDMNESNRRDDHTTDATDASGADNDDDILPILLPGDIVEKDSFLNCILERHSLTWRSVRQEMLRLIMSVLLRDNFYRCVFAVKFTRSYSSLIQNHIYDDHLIGDSLCGLSCQFYTVISLARQLLEQNNVLTRLLTRLTNAFQANSIVLPYFYFYTATNQNIPMDIQEEVNIASMMMNTPDTTTLSWINAMLDLLRRLNPFEWGSSSSSSSSSIGSSYIVNNHHQQLTSLSTANCVLPEPRVLSWQPGNTIARSWFHPFERLFHVIRDIDYILASLTNVQQPVAINNNTDNDGNSTLTTWWTEAARSSFLDYIRQFLALLSFVQDMNGMQRETQNHVEEELEWASGFYIMSLLISLLGLTVQVASSDYELYNLVLREVRQVFETRIGIMDRRFRIKPLPIDLNTNDHNNNNNNNNSNNNESTNHVMSSKLYFHSLGVTTEVYVYDVSVYRLSLLQPIPRLLASLYGHGLEMGLNFENLGLLDQGFINLLIERPLQIFAFCAQFNAKMWVRNGFAVQQSMTNLFSPSIRVELIDRDLQLLQIASCILPPDEFLIRLIHKFHLGNYLKNYVTSKEPGPGRVQAVEMLLRVLLACVTNRARPSMGYFSKDYYLMNNFHQKLANGCSLDEILIDTESEIYYANLINDVIHTLCLKPLSYSELLSILPYQNATSLLLKIPTEQHVESTSTQQHHHHDHDQSNNESEDHEMGAQDVQSLSTTSCPTRRQPVALPASVSRSANKRAIENVLPKILHKIAVQLSVNNKTVFSIRPEFMAYRFNRFYWGYRHADQTAAETNVSKVLKKWLQQVDANQNVELKNLPIPPPIPRPLHKFKSSLSSGPLQIIQCVTFVRFIKILLDIAYTSHGGGCAGGGGAGGGTSSSSSSSWWSNNLLDLLLHLIITALYEDELSGSKTGSYPFLSAVSRVPEQNESDAELKELARTGHWLKPVIIEKSVLFTLIKNNCITSRLVRILNSAHYDDHSDLIRWTLDYWNKVVQTMSDEQPSLGKQTSESGEIIEESPSYQLSNAQIKQDRAEKARARRARIMARMSNMQRNFMDSLTQNEATTNEAELMDIDYPEVNNDNLNQSTTAQSTVVQQCALGPTRSLGSAAAYLFPNSSSSSQGGMEVQNTELVTCNLCLEEVAEQASSRMVMAAHVCRSSVLSSHGISWLEGPVTMSVVKRLSSDLDMVDSMCSTTIDRHHDKSYSVHGDENQLIPFLASVSTTAAATCAGSSRMGLRIIPELLSGIQCLEVQKDTTTTTTELTDKSALGPGLIDQLFTNQDEMNHSIILDRWHPRPLVSSRDPIAEEGSFFTFCSHPMHATCKTKYAKQIKGRVDNLNRRNSSMLVFEFRCPLCKCISTLDLPMLGPIYLDIPIEWLQSRLLPSINHDQSSVHQLGSTATTTPTTATTTTNINNNHAHFQPLSSWLHNLSRWLDMSSDVNDYILGPLFSSNFIDQKSIMTDHLQNTSTLEDYALWNFGNLITADINNVTYPSYSSTTTPSTSVDMDVDHDYSSTCLKPQQHSTSTSGNNYEFIAQRIHSIMKRVKYSLIVQDSTEQDYHHHELNAKKKHSKTTTDCGISSSSSSSSNVGVGGSSTSSSLNPLSRQFWTSRRFSRRSSTDNDNVSMNSSNSNHGNSNNNNNNNNNHATTLSIGNNPLKNLLPPQSSSPLVTTNLFALVQRLASLCQPKSVDTLVQRPIGRRTTTTTTTTATATATAEVVVNNTPTIVPLPNDINEEQDDDDDDDDGDDGDEDQDGAVAAAVATDQVVAFVVTDTPIQSTASTLSTSNIQVLMTQTEFDSPPSTTTTHHHNLTMNSSSTCLSKQSVLFNANLNLSEAIELFHLDFMSFYERLRTLNSLIPQNVTTTVTSATNAATTTPATTAATTTTNCPKSQLSSHRPVKKKTSSHTTTTTSAAASSSQAATPSSSVTTTTGVDDDINQKYIMNSFNSTKHYLERIAQRARNVIWSAACEWRSLRHSVAYTLIGSERALRLHSCYEHFFNGGLAERRLHGLGHLLRTSLTAHSRHAVVSRGCSLSCDAAANDDGKTTTTTGHRLCWSQLKTHPIHWWWWSYCVPFDVVPNSQLKDVLPDCRLNNPSTIINIAETAVSIAATEDARFLWRLLLPPLENYKSDALTSNLSEQSQQQPTNANTSMPASTYSMNAINQPTTTTTSLLWDVDITSLFISLLHLRPGLEEFTVNQCQCTRLANVANADISQESGTASLGAYLLACDEGRLRLPIGDSHETHLLRLCYAALLVQSLIAWQPRMDCLNYLKKHQLLPQSCTWNDNYVKSAHWNLPELLDVWRLLRDLCGLPAWNSSSNNVSNNSNNDDPQMMAQSLGLFLRANCLPFLRIAAFVIHKITGVDVPSELRQSTNLDPMNEHSLLLAYLGLPLTPSDLLILLKSPESNQAPLISQPLSPSASSTSTSTSSSLNSSSHQPEKLSHISLLSESLWLARLITSWCLTGRQSLSRQIYQSLLHRYIVTNEQTSNQKTNNNNAIALIHDLIPYPNTDLPNLIQLPKEYTSLLLLATDMDCHAEGHTHSDLSLCLVCGHLACLFCYGCRQFEQKTNSNLFGSGRTTISSSHNQNTSSSSSSSSNNQEFAVYRMQAHSRRCHSGYSLLLRIHSCRVVLLSDQARRITEVPAPYRDAFGETDPDLRRGNPLFLVESEYQRINQLWISHQLASSTPSDLITPSNLQFGLY